MNDTGSTAGTRIALVPLDERPVCTKLPAMVAAVAGVPVVTPPARLMPRLRTPGDPEGLGRWLASTTGTTRPRGARGPSPRAAAAVVSLETLGYGGLIASRTSPGTTAGIAGRWAPLHRLASAGVPVHAVTLVTRTPDSADAMEEPAYWDPYGPALHRLSADLHRAATGAVGDGPPGAPEVPAPIRADFLARRLRNHTLNLAALELLTTGTLSSLVIGADDTAPHALATAELDWLRQWARWLDRPEALAVRPGADEACTTLVARTVLGLLGGPRPRVSVEAVVPAELSRVAPYENGPVALTAERQIAACGGLPVPAGEPCELRLLLNTPDGSGVDWAVAPPPPGRGHPDAQARARALAERAAGHIEAGEAVAVADCAQPNGADPLLVEALREQGVLARLSAYAGWNTAGNTLGTAAAHGITAVAARRAGRFDGQAHRRLLAHRFLEDWAYPTRARGAARAALGSNPLRHDVVRPGHPVLAEIERELVASAEELGAFAPYSVAPGSVRLPWDRTFEADFDLTTDTPQERR